MKTNTTAKIVIFPQQTKKGFPLKIRIIQNRKPTYIGLKYFLTENQRLKYWNATKKELRHSYPFYDDVNKELDDELKKLGIEKKKEIDTPLDEFKEYVQSFHRLSSCRRFYHFIIEYGRSHYHRIRSCLTYSSDICS